ncbi:Wzz/FepE/Etk N-terminal domain-containing protein [Membranihabitans marinus]|uniref:Wzz/FepE/Etk N-terminal domain-containing protein n=1 Tax=Membranihabitans marinus TaxID=1227546 RepID=UPI001F0045B9|nr:Wzz/FepE/Etk N-terminal domain-containing protein [Membranihabitans marinus]
MAANENMDHEITLKELIFKVREFALYIWDQRKYILLFTILLGLAMGVYAYMQPKIFTSQLTFMVNEDEGGSTSSATSVLSQLGLGLGNSNTLNFERLVSLAKSQNIVNATLLDSTEIEGKTDRLANFLIDHFNLHEKWKENEELRNYYIPTKVQSEDEINVNKALKALYGCLILKDQAKTPGVVQISFDDESFIVTMTGSAEDPDITQRCLELHYDNLSKFYIDKSIEKQKTTVDVLKSRKDSIELLLNRTETNMASMQDRSLGVYLNKDLTQLSKMNRENQVLAIMYAEVVKNYETANFMLDNQKPIFQVIDRPLPPISGSKKSPITQTIMGFILGGILSSLFFFVKKIISESLI